MIRVKDTVRNLPPYVVPGAGFRVKLNQNESPFDIPADLKQEITQRLMERQWNRYPDNFGDPLKEKLADYLGFPAAGIVVGNSSNELIQAVIYSLCDTGDRIVVTDPGFPIYKRVASVMNIGVTEVPLRNDFSCDTAAIIAASAGSQLVILASPNNPTGAVLTVEDIAGIADAIDGVLVVDEAYYEFCKQSAQNLITSYNNIIITRTFSKAFNLAGIRLGYMLGNNFFIDDVSKSKLPFSVGLFQQVVGEVVMENRGFVEENVARVVAERERVMEALLEMPGIRPFPSFANFILFRSARVEAEALFWTLYERGVVVRYFDTPQLSGCLRVTIGTPEENETFIQKLTQVLK